MKVLLPPNLLSTIELTAVFRCKPLEPTFPAPFNVRVPAESVPAEPITAPLSVTLPERAVNPPAPSVVAPPSAKSKLPPLNMPDRVSPLASLMKTLPAVLLSTSVVTAVFKRFGSEPTLPAPLRVSVPPDNVPPSKSLTAPSRVTLPAPAFNPLAASAVMPPSTKSRLPPVIVPDRVSPSVSFTNVSPPLLLSTSELTVVLSRVMLVPTFPLPVNVSVPAERVPAEPATAPPNVTFPPLAFSPPAARAVAPPSSRSRLPPEKLPDNVRPSVSLTNASPLLLLSTSASTVVFKRVTLDPTFPEPVNVRVLPDTWPEPVTAPPSVILAPFALMVGELLKITGPARPTLPEPPPVVRFAAMLIVPLPPLTVIEIAPLACDLALVSITEPTLIFTV